MLVWSKQYEIGIPVIDGQHQRIIHYINQVNALQASQDVAHQLDEVLAMLIDYTHSHFAFEEALMEEAGYPHLMEHQHTHQCFINQLDALHKRFKNGEKIAHQLADMLQRWLLEHIQSDDSSYAGCVKARIRDVATQVWVESTRQRVFRHFS